MLNEYGGETRYRSFRLTGNVTVEPIKGWQTNLMVSRSEGTSISQSYTSKKHYSLVQKEDYNGSASKGEGGDKSDNLEITSKYDKTIGKHRFNVLVGYSYLYNMYDGFSASNGNFPSEAYLYNNLSLGTLLTEKDRHAGMSSYKNDNTLVGFFGRVSYAFNDRYNLLVSVRREGSSKFGDNNKWGTFPSVSAGWTISKEDFMKNLSWLDNLKIRVGYGVTGVIPDNSYISQRLYTYDNYGDVLSPDGTWTKTLQSTQNPNPDLKWETTSEVNMGLDFSVFNGRVSGSFDYYIKTTKDLLYDYAVPVPPNLFPTTTANVGEMENKGYELMIEGKPFVGDFSWTTTLTMSGYKNKLVSLSNDLYVTDNFKEEGGLGEPISVATHYMEVGSPLGEFWGLKSVGVDKDGFVLVEVSDGNGGWTVKPFNTNLNVQENRQKLGSGLPKMYLGWGNTFNYKGFDLTLQFTGQFGYKILNAQRCYYENNSSAYNRLKSAADTYPAVAYNKETKQLEPVLDENGNQLQVTLSKSMSQGFWSDHLEKGDYLKLSNVTLGYKIPIPESFVKYVNSARVYVSASNVFCITGYSGIDPEVSNYFLAPGIDYQDKYPTTRSFSFGLTLNF
jgi:TonB-linked SusC/RagA family outer membrane protein